MKKLLLLIGVCCSFALGYGVIAEAFPSGGLYGRGQYRGYFTNTQDTNGTYVFPRQYKSGTESLPDTINNATAFINFIKYTQLDIDGNGSSNAQERTGAAFIIQTMIGSARNKPPTAAQIADWEARVRYAESQGRISWRTNYSYNINSFYQGTGSGSNPDDDAFYDESGTQAAIVFRNASGGVAYAIKWSCANPVGSPQPLPPAPSINFTTVGRSTVSNASPTPGSTITFSHYVKNNGPTGTSPTNIWWIAERTEPTPVTLVGGSASSGTYTSGQEKNVFNHTITIPADTPPGTRFCERVGWDPVTSGGVRDGRGTPVCATVQYSFTLTPSVSAVINSSGSPITGNIAEAGDTVTFTYAVNNSGSTVSQAVTCTYRQDTRPGNNQSAPGSTFTPPGANCAPTRTFPANANTVVATETVPASTVNTTICKSLTISPVTQDGGSQTAQACVLVAAKPYVRVWGGDVSAGNGLADASSGGICTDNTNAAIVGWNKRSAGNNAGAGTQFAAYALARITDFATALYDPGGAESPAGLSFSNQSLSLSNGNFGGSFGSLPCIPDYYSSRPASTLAVPGNVSAMTTGTYGADGNIQLSGGTNNIEPGERITLYVDGNVYINTNIIYSGSWNVSNVPRFQIIARGNIYVDLNVSQLDGIYIAQGRDGNRGQIHTCASTANMFSPLPLGGNLYNSCTKKLTVNGAFIADQVRLLRTIGTLAQSSNSESSSESPAAEVFNYGPALWLAQPADQGGSTPDYDAIISLPPIL